MQIMNSHYYDDVHVKLRFSVITEENIKYYY